MQNGSGVFSVAPEAVLPNLGLTLDPGSGAISGTPAASGWSAFEAQVQTCDGQIAKRQCTIFVADCTIDKVQISNTSWNKFRYNAPAVVWVHAHIGKPSGIKPGQSWISFTGVKLTLNGVDYQLPNGLITFNPAWKETTTWFHEGLDLWETTINPNNLSDEIFFVGAAIPVTDAIASGGKATFSVNVATDDASLAFSWKWSAAVYTFWPENWNLALIQPFHKSLHAGTPLNRDVQKSLIQGPRGGGGSNFTGSWSATGSAVCPISGSCPSSPYCSR